MFYIHNHAQQEHVQDFHCGDDHNFFWIALSRQVHGLLLDVHSERCVLLWFALLFFVGCTLQVCLRFVVSDWMCIAGMSLSSVLLNLQGLG